MKLIKTGALNAIAVVIRILTLLGLNKVLAIYVGPAGYAAVGQFQNAVQMITTFASGALNTGVTKYTAEYYDDPVQQHRLWQTAGTIALLGSIVTGLVIGFCNKILAVWFLNNEQYGSVFIWFAVTLVLFTFNTLLLAILNGKKAIKQYVIANIGGSLLALALTTFMTVVLGLYGALVALAIYQSVAFFITLLICYRTEWFNPRYILGPVDSKAAKNLFKYTLMALVSAACVPMSQILIRDYIGSHIGWAQAGLWEATCRLSSAYLMLVTTTLSVYYLPRLAELKLKSELKKEIISTYKVVLPVAVLCSITIFVLRDFIIHILFTNEFIEMRNLFAWQMLGDTLKIGSWILSYLMLGRAMYKIFIVTEVIFSALFVVLSVVLINMIGLKGVAMAYALNYLLYWLFVYVYMNKYLSTNEFSLANKI